MEGKKKVVKKSPTKKVTKKEVQKPVKVYTNVGPKRKEINNLGLLVQAVLTTYAILLLIGSLFDAFFLDIFDAVVSMLLFATAYNNNKVFKRKNLTVIYILAGIFFAGTFIYNLFS